MRIDAYEPIEPGSTEIESDSFWCGFKIGFVAGVFVAIAITIAEML